MHSKRLICQHPLSLFSKTLLESNLFPAVKTDDHKPVLLIIRHTFTFPVVDKRSIKPQTSILRLQQRDAYF